ncbi:MAG TPA: class I SAM-dependent methyltransferase [Gammaproteobacteria bacterium]|nr:class I SAM-dependent methyltransferase [Gammaproteobacteria bacterium]
MSANTLNFTPLIYAYYQKHAFRDTEILRKLREQTHKMSMGNMQISPEQGQFMALLIQLMKAKKTLDIGVFTGYSALCVAEALPPDGKVIGCDINVEWTKIAKRFWEMAGVADKIDLRLAPALETLQALIDEGEAGTFDFAFIDADKKSYLDYYEKALILIKSGGLIAIDNVLYGGEVADPDMSDANVRAICELNEILLVDERVSISMLPIGDGLTLVFKQ